MAVALRDRPVLQFPQPEGISVVSWDSSNGTVTDAFKPGQVPGASSGTIGGGGGGTVMSDAPGGGGTVHGGVDSSLGGLY